MTKTTLGVALLALASLGAGCTAPQLPNWSIFPQDIPAVDVDLAVASTITLEQVDVNPLENIGEQQRRSLTIEEWTTGQTAKFSWQETFERETAASIESRSAAEHATGVGEETRIPDPIFTTINLEGSIQTDALDDGDRMLLPSEWQEDDVDLTGSDNTTIWLSTAQYNELAETRHTHLALGAIDSSLQTAANAAEVVKGLIAKITGGDETPTTESDITEVVASADWGTYTLEWNGKKVKVQTIQAENKLASYTILANPENPIVLEVELKAWAYGTEALGVLSDDLKISGYSITEISSPE